MTSSQILARGCRWVALIGHRGVGKTSLLKRIEEHHHFVGQRVLCFDLDREIEKRTGRAIDEIFSSDGEAEFRRIERSIFAELNRELGDSPSHAFDTPVYCALGAGFDLRCLNDEWRAIWVRRRTDSRGRVFVNSARPRLNKNVSPLDEYLQRFAEREKRYRARADEVLILDEGLDSDEAGLDSAEAHFFLGNQELAESGAAITLMPDVFANAADESPVSSQVSWRRGLADWWQRRLTWGLGWVELRDDLLSESQFVEALELLPNKKVLLSFRDEKRREASAALVASEGLAFDWPLERGPCPYGEPQVYSLHERLPGQSVSTALRRFDVVSGEAVSILKAALPVENFSDLQEGEEWRQADPHRRVFLPLSADGRWTWYRLRVGRHAPLAFVRESDGSGADQPTILQWWRETRLAGHQQFAAVLGAPVAHSRTPIEHRSFFAVDDVPVYAIRMSEADWSSGALEFLRLLGLRWAAVTAPLKKLAYETCRDGGLECENSDMPAINTLAWSSPTFERGRWLGENTDLEGFAAMLLSMRELGEREFSRFAVWGGGGTLEMMRRVLPEAEFFSARTGQNRRDGGPQAEVYLPEVVVWAAGAEDANIIETFSWHPKVVVDLSYTEDSPGRSYAVACGAHYVSGLEMFRVQARAQRRFWREVRERTENGKRK